MKNALGQAAVLGRMCSGLGWGLALGFSLFFWSACLKRQHAADNLGSSAVVVSGVALEFANDTRGRLEFSLQTPVDFGVEQVVIYWELWLQNRLFASGSQAVDRSESTPREWKVQAPLAFRRRTLSEGRNEVDVAIRGFIEPHGENGTRWPFMHHDRSSIFGAPTADPAED